jgi:hypothetical protein
VVLAPVTSAVVVVVAGVVPVVDGPVVVPVGEVIVGDVLVPVVVPVGAVVVPTGVVLVPEVVVPVGEVVVPVGEVVVPVGAGVVVGVLVDVAGAVPLLEPVELVVLVLCVDRPTPPLELTVAVPDEAGGVEDGGMITAGDCVGSGA